MFYNQIQNFQPGKFCFGVEVNSESFHGLQLINIYLMLKRDSELKSGL